jgi:predicted nucleic acid-binding protein
MSADDEKRRAGQEAFEKLLGEAKAAQQAKQVADIPAAPPAKRTTKAAQVPPSMTPPLTPVPPATKAEATAGAAGAGGQPAVLLDSNTLTALLIGDHIHHEIVAEWYATSGRKYATCPFTENSLVRTLIRSRHSASEVGWLLVRLTADTRHEFWGDQLPYSAVPLTAVVGHRQVTDAYLVALARHRGSQVLTLDRGLASLHPDVCELLETPEAGNKTA